MIKRKEIRYDTAYIPSGMYLSVETNRQTQSRILSGMHLSVAFGDTPHTLHPVGDASLTGCKRGGNMTFSTERCIPDGMLTECNYPQLFN